MRLMEEFIDIALDVLADAALDTLTLIPFLFVTYLAMEWLEHKTGIKTQEAVRKAGTAGPAIGAVLGVVPQCGFSAAASTLYAGRVITLGTLFAVYLSTSDEMLPIFIAEQAPMGTIVSVLVTKLIIGMVMGFAIDFAVRRCSAAQEGLRIHELCQRDRCDCSHNCQTCTEHPEMVYGHHDDCAKNCDHQHHAHDHSHDHGSGGWSGIIRSALKHTLEVTVFVFAISLALNAVIEGVGEDALAAFVSQNEALSIVCSAIVGLIPNCAASVAIAQLYLEGVLGSGAMIAGLLVSAGVGLLVLARANRPVSRTVAIIAGLLVTGIVWGLLISLVGITF